MKRFVVAGLLALAAAAQAGSYQDKGAWQQKQNAEQQKQWEQKQMWQKQQWEQQQMRAKRDECKQVGGCNDMKPPVLVPEIGFTARLEDGKVKTAWKKYTRPDFKYYKVVRSIVKKEPVYPEDGAVKFFDDAGQTAYEDWNGTPGTWYYRLCIITQTGERWVSTVVPVQIGAGAAPADKPGAADFQ